MVELNGRGRHEAQRGLDLQAHIEALGHAVAGREVLRGKKSLREQTRTPILQVINMAKPTDACSGPRGCHDGPHAALVEKIGDLLIGVGIDESVDLLDDSRIGRAQYDA